MKDHKKDKEHLKKIEEGLKKEAEEFSDELHKEGQELSGDGMDDVLVDYNSSKPGQFSEDVDNEGNQVHLDLPQEHHVPHAAWHVVQQKQGIQSESLDRDEESDDALDTEDKD